MAQNVIYWKFDTNTLYIRGEDATGYTIWSIPSSNYSYSTVPWYSSRSSITSVIFETSIDITTMRYWFYNCTNFNQPITIPSSVTNMESCFSGCTNFNQPITIPSSVTNMYHCFFYCEAFNSTVTFQTPSSVTDMRYCFYNCTSFNQPINIPSSVTDMLCCFDSCTSFNQPVTIPNSAYNMNYCFRDCTSLNSTITINTDSSNYTDIFTDTSLPIYIKGVSKNLNSIANAYSNVSVKRSFLYRMLHYLTQLNAECDYLIRIAETSINVTTTFSSVLQSNLSGVTASTHSEYLIGNYLTVRAVINVNSTAQSTIGTGNVTNRLLCTIKIPDFYYPSSGDTSYASLTNEQKFTRASSVGSYSQAIPTGTSSGNAQPATFYISREYSGNDVLIHFTIGANIVSTTQYELCAIVPVTRIPFNYSEI